MPIDQFTGPAGVTITAGQLVGLYTDGTIILADADAVVKCRGIAINGGTAGVAINAVAKGDVDCGDIFSGLAYSANVFQSVTAGYMADAVYSTDVAIGYVKPAWGNTTADKLLHIDV
jgi:hypothetical protein